MRNSFISFSLSGVMAAHVVFFTADLPKDIETDFPSSAKIAISSTAGSATVAPGLIEVLETIGGDTIRYVHSDETRASLSHRST